MMGMLQLEVDRGPVMNYPPPLQYDRPLDQPRHCTQRVRDHQDRCSLFEERLDRRRETLLVGEVDARNGFVQHQYFGLGGEGPPDEDTLLLAAGKASDRRAPGMDKVDEFEGLCNRSTIGTSIAAQQPDPSRASGQEDLFDGGGYAGRRRHPLRHVADPLPTLETFDSFSE